MNIPLSLNIKMAQFVFFLNILWYSAWFFYIKFLIYGAILLIWKKLT